MLLANILFNDVSGTTKCVIQEGRSLVDGDYPSLLGAVLIAKRFYQRQCHHKSNLPAAECILDLIGMIYIYYVHIDAYR